MSPPASRRDGKRKVNRMKRWICLWLAIAFMLSGAAYAGAPDSGDPSGDGAAGSIKRVGVQTGTNFDSIIMDKLPDAQVEYYNTKADLVAALTGDKIDGFVVDEPVANILIRENPNLTYLPEYLDTFKFAFGFSKTEEGQRLRDEFNAFLKSLPEGALE